jgi:hypothetical protein
LYFSNSIQMHYITYCVFIKVAAVEIILILQR